MLVKYKIVSLTICCFMRYQAEGDQSDEISHDLTYNTPPPLPKPLPFWVYTLKKACVIVYVTESACFTFDFGIDTKLIRKSVIFKLMTFNPVSHWGSFNVMGLRGSLCNFRKVCILWRWRNTVKSLGLCLFLIHIFW